MRIGEEYRPSETVAVRHAQTLCDLCGKDTQRPTYYDDGEVTIEALVGDNFPSGDNRDAYQIDVCVECFLERVKPAIEALGVKFRKCDVDERWGYQQVRKLGKDV